MNKLKYYLSSPSDWSEAVKKMWDIKRTSMFLNAGIAILTLVIIGIFWMTAALFVNDLEDASMPLFLFFGSLYHICLFASLLIYLLEWLFYFNIKRWVGVVPEKLKKGIKQLSLFIFISLIATAVAYFLDKLTTIPYVAIIANLVLTPTYLAIVAMEICQFVAFVKLRKAEDMPDEAKRGFSWITLSYITKFGGYIIGAICLLISLIAASVDDDVDLEYMREYNTTAFLAQDWAPDDYFEFDFDNPMSATALPTVGPTWYFDNMGMLFDHDVETRERLVYYLMYGTCHDCEEAIEELTDSDVFTFFSIVGLIFIAVGALGGFVLYYRGWWYVAQSKLEPVAKPVTEDTPYEDVTEAEVIETETKEE